MYLRLLNHYFFLCKKSFFALQLSVQRQNTVKNCDPYYIDLPEEQCSCSLSNVSFGRGLQGGLLGLIEQSEVGVFHDLG